MKTNIEINEEALREIIRLGKAKNKRQAINLSIKNYLKLLAQLQILKLRGKVKWEGDLDQMRTSKYL